MDWGREVTLYRLIRPILFLLPPEVAHRLAILVLKRPRIPRAPTPYENYHAARIAEIMRELETHSR